MVVAHIGLMKTGSTSLQDFVLRDDRIVARVQDQRYYKNNAGEKETFGDDLLFVSDENLSREYNKVTTLKGSIKNLQSHHEIDKYLIVIRDQFSFLSSCYKHHLKQTYDPVGFDEWLAAKAGSSQLKLCYFNKLIEELETICGDVEMHVLLFEEMLKDEKEFLKRFYEVLELSPMEECRFPSSNKSFKKEYYPTKLRFNRTLGKIKAFRGSVIEKAFIKLGTSLSKKELKVWDKISPDKFKQLKEEFKLENEKLASKFDLNLKEHNYTL